MKKVFVILGLYVLATTMSVFAQYEGVKGIETRKIDMPNHGDGINTPNEGFEFYNSNNYTVTVEVALLRPPYPNSKNENGVYYIVIETKTFILKAKEKYEWPTWFYSVNIDYLDKDENQEKQKTAYVVEHYVVLKEVKGI